MGAENFAPTRIRLRDCPACSKSLYRLRYPGPPFRWVQTWISTVLLCSVKSAVFYCHLTEKMSKHYWLGTNHKITAYDVFDSKHINRANAGHHHLTLSSTCKSQAHSVYFILLHLPIDSLRVGSSDTFSSFPKYPLMALNTLSRTDFSGSTVSWHNAGRMRTATSDRRKYCCVAASANTPKHKIAVTASTNSMG